MAKGGAGPGLVCAGILSTHVGQSSAFQSAHASSRRAFRRPIARAWQLGMARASGTDNRLQRPVMDVIVTGRDEAFEERMRLVGLALEFRMKLARHEERMILQFDHFNQFSVR